MNYLIDLKTLRNIDVEGIYKTYDNWPEMGDQHFNSNIEQIDSKKYSHIVFAGMGGSGSLGDIFSSILSKTNIHVDVVKGYLLPKTVNMNTLVVITSISGNPLSNKRPPKEPNVWAVRTDNWKFIRNIHDGTEELYNLKEDPNEEKNVILDYSKEADHLRNELNQLAE